MSEPLVLVDREDAIAIVTLNRPDALNALNSALRRAIVRTFRDLQADPSVEVVVLTGKGRAFTAGLDLKELGGETAAAGGAGVPADAINDTDLLAAVEAFDRPVIGAINGYAITGGFELALMCDILIASSEARFADTHARVGVVPGWGLSQRLARLIGASRAKELSLTGNFLHAELACEWGLVNRVVAPEELLPVCVQLARDIVSTDFTTRQEILRLIDVGWDGTLADGMRAEHEASVAHSKREVRPEKVAERRRGIQQRGRQQG